MEKLKRWHTVGEASIYLNRSQRQILRYISDGRLKAYQSIFRGKWSFKIKDLDAFIVYNCWYSKLNKPQKREIDVL